MIGKIMAYQRNPSVTDKRDRPRTKVDTSPRKIDMEDRDAGRLGGTVPVSPSPKGGICRLVLAARDVNVVGPFFISQGLMGGSVF